MLSVKPINFKVLENTITKDETPLWDKEKSYKKDEKVQFNGRIYVSASDEDTHAEPVSYFEKWVDFGASNENAFYDEKIGTQSKDNKTWQITIETNESFDTLAFLNLDIARLVILAHDDTLIYEKELIERKSTNWWEFFFSPFKFIRDEFVFLTYTARGRIKIIFESRGGICNVGHILLGKKTFLGITLYPSNFTYLNYSKTSTNEWGETQIIEGAKARYIEYIVAIERDEFDYYDELIASLYNTPALFIGDERDKGFKRLSTYGILKDYSAPLEEMDKIQYKLNVQGLI